MTGVHPPARDLLLLAVDAGWSALINHSVDAGGTPFVTVEGRAYNDDHSKMTHKFIVTWHTRDTGTYRLYHAMLGSPNLTDVPLKCVRQTVTERTTP